MRGRTASAWGGRQPRPFTPRKSGNYTAPAQQVGNRPTLEYRPDLGTPDFGLIFFPLK
jgi:hypothetical protein